MSSPSAATYFDMFSSAGTPRTPEEIKKQSQKILGEAFKKLFFSKGETVGSSCLPASSLRAVKGIDVKVDFEALFVGFIVSYGNYTEDTLWLRTKPGSDVFVSCPMLAAAGNKGALQRALSEKIGELIESGKDSNLIQFLTRCGIKVDQKHRKYMFSKGFSLASNKENALKLKEDIDIIIKNMSDNKNKKDPTFNGNFKILKTTGLKKEDSSL
jgi:hypothetical protein